MRLLYILLFSVTLFAGEWTITDFTIRGKQLSVSATGILKGNPTRIPSYQAPKRDELLLRRRLDVDNYGLYIGKAEAKAYNSLSRFTKPSGMSMDTLLKVKFYTSQVPTGYNDVIDVYFKDEYIYVQNMERVFYKDGGSWKSLENAQLAKNEKFRVFYDITPADFSLFVDNDAAQSELVYGLHNFRFSAPGYSFLDTTLVLISDTTIQCVLGVAQTEVKIVVKNSVSGMFLGGVEVEVNGVSYGTDPRSISLKSGEHNVTLKKEGFETFTTSLKVGTLPFEKEYQLSPKMVDKQVPLQPTDVVLEVDKEELAKQGIEIKGDFSEYVERACIVIQNRLEKLGFSPCKVIRQKDNTILLELPKPLNKSQDVILSTANLEFYPVINDFYSASYKELLNSIDSITKSTGDGSAISLSSLYKNRSFPASEKENITKILNQNEVKTFLKGTKLLWGYYPEESDGDQSHKRFNLYHVDATPAMTGEKIVNANSSLSQQSGDNMYMVSITFSSAGAKEFSDITHRYIGRQLAISLDNKIYSAPNITGKISGGSAMISGKFTEEEAKNLAVVLSCGRNTLPLNIVKVTEKY